MVKRGDCCNLRKDCQHKQKMKKVLSLLGMIIILSSNIVFSAPAPKKSATQSKVTQKEENTITIFHTSDLNGFLRGTEENNVIDFSNIGGIKNGFPSSILVDSGNSLRGNLSLQPSNGAKMVELMNMAKYDFVGLGIRDFEYTSDRIMELSGLAEFEMLSSNITKRGKTLYGSAAIKEIDELKVGFFSLINEDTKKQSKRENINELMFQEIHSTARNCVSDLKARGANIIVALTSIGEKSATDIATLVDGINIIIDGSNEKPIRSDSTVGRLIGRTLLVSTGSNAENIGRINIILDDNKAVLRYSSSMFTNKDMETVPKNEDIDKIITEITEEADKIYNEQIYTSSVFLKNDNDMQVKSTSLGNFIADVYKSSSNADIAIISASEINSDFKTGKITRSDISGLLNPNSTVQIKKISPRILRLVLEGAISKAVLKDNKSLDEANSASTKFLQISGFKFHYNPRNEVGHKVVKIVLDDGRSLNLNDSNSNIRIAASSFLMTGGDENTALAGITDVLQQFDNVGTVITNYLISGGQVTENNEERILLTDKKEDMTRIWIMAALAVFGIVIAIIGISNLISRIK